MNKRSFEYDQENRIQKEAMPMLISKKRKTKKSKIRHAEYYDLVATFDDLYAKSKENQMFNRLMPLILSEENILLAYRNIKCNKGSETSGVDEKTIRNLDV